jgi:hypothetical protein
MGKRVALIAGAIGFVWRGIVEQLARAGDWEGVGLGRQELEVWAGVFPVDFVVFSGSTSPNSHVVRQSMSQFMISKILLSK